MQLKCDDPGGQQFYELKYILAGALALTQLNEPDKALAATFTP